MKHTVGSAMALDESTSPELATRIKEGMVAGVFAGMTMAAVVMVHAQVTGFGFFTPLRLISASLFGESALSGGIGMLVLGVMLHLAASAGWGGAFGALRPNGLGLTSTIALGLVTGVASWVVMTYVALPIINPTMAASVGTQPDAWFLEHVVFGAFLGVLAASREHP